MSAVIRLRRTWPLLLILAGMGLAYGLGLHEQISFEALAARRDGLRSWVDAHPSLAPLAYGALYAATVALSLPFASILTVFSGFLFGWATGTAITVVSATLGACVIFLVARSSFGTALRSRVDGAALRLARGFEQDAFSYLLILRLAPVVPFFVLNVASALFDIRLRSFAAATFLGIIPGSLAYVYLGTGLDSVITAAARADRPPTLADLATPQLSLALVGLAAAAALPLLVRSLRKHAS